MRATKHQQKKQIQYKQVHFHCCSDKDDKQTRSVALFRRTLAAHPLNCNMAAITVKVTIIGQLDKSGHLDPAKKESYIITLADQDKSIWYTRIIHIIYARGSWLSMATVGLDCLKLHWVGEFGYHIRK